MLIRFAVEGGFANQMRSIVIGADGAATTEVGGVSSDDQLEAATLEAIVAELERSGLFDRDRTYEARGADLQRLEVRYGGSTIVAHDTSIPDELGEAVRLLEEVIRRFRTG